MKNFNENGVMFTENEKMQIVNTINGFRDFSPAVKPCKREFIVGNVKFRVIINSITGGYDANLTIECAVKGNNGRYGNMNCYSNTIISKYAWQNSYWKWKTIKAFEKDIFGDVTPESEDNETSNQIVNNIEDLNIPESFDTPETFVMGASYENDGCFQSCVEKYGEKFIDAVSVLWNKHLQYMTENNNILIDDNDTMFGEYFSEHFIAFRESAIQFWNEVAEYSDKFNKKDRWVVIAKCSDGDIVIHKDGEIAFDIDIAGEIAKDHQNMGAEIEIMRYADYKEMYN